MSDGSPVNEIQAPNLTAHQDEWHGLGAPLLGRGSAVRAFEFLCPRARKFEYGSLQFKFHIVIKVLRKFSVTHQDHRTLFFLFWNHFVAQILEKIVPFQINDSSRVLAQSQHNYNAGKSPMTLINIPIFEIFDP